MTRCIGPHVRKAFQQREGIFYPLELAFHAQFMQHLPFETELDPPHRRLFFHVPSIGLPQVMEPPLLTLLADFARLVVDDTGDRATPREEEPRTREPIGEILDVQIGHLIRSTLAGARDEITTLINRLHIPPSNIGTQMDFGDLQVHAFLQEVMHQELFHPHNGIIHPTTGPQELRREAHLRHTVQAAHGDEQIEALAAQQPAPLALTGTVGVHVQVHALEGEWNRYWFFLDNSRLLPGIQLFLELMGYLTFTRLVLPITKVHVEHESVYPTSHDQRWFVRIHRRPRFLLLVVLGARVTWPAPKPVWLPSANGGAGSPPAVAGAGRWQQGSRHPWSTRPTVAKHQ